MKTIYIYILFIILAIAQVAVPTQMILHRESILKTGKAYKFKTEPIDPADPFKGKYIFLNYDNERVKAQNENWQRHQEVYITIIEDSLGFAKPILASIDQPKTGPYVKAKVNYYSAHDKSLDFRYPFSEFYMNEHKAYDAELAYRDSQRDSVPNNTYALVFVKNGEAVLDNVFINDIPIATYVEKD
ncbi:Uncharacterized membrane-anchored protein [Formosa sp. Hel1_31_208]|uniref:GDYXXLXY domain-containing protein n=1 Tax=Formosa sp. Hel1_31_208 TaxID=1798225 RepID=UPI00087C5F90|nr:GDYXXLXY domain-containing protein [Formosa sp. Hel1_31_208]SDR65771.1 Uncharacterized membrane-anchored protein [Formosa sp. Hel1_31_208]